MFQIAAPDVSSKRLKRRNAMSVIEANPVENECILSASDTYIETLTVKQIEAQPWLSDRMVIERGCKARPFSIASNLLEL